MTDLLRGSARSATVAARDVAGWVPLAARMGYAAKGVVYLLVGWIALKAAMATGEPEGAAGALQSLRDESGGRAMLLAIALGLAGHVLWRVVQALLDPEHAGGGVEKRAGMRAFYALSGAIYASLAITAWQLSRGTGSGASGEGHEIWISRALEKPFGTWLVMAAGVGVVAYGIQQLLKAWKGDVNKHIDARSERVQRGMRLLGRAGTAARGLVMLPIGWFVFNAGRHYRAQEAADTGEVLKMLGHGWLLALVALGLAAYGAHQVGKALYRRIQRPT